MLSSASILFFLSGITALLYQVVWQRMLGLFSGADVYAATIIVGAFMAGLGIGSLAGGGLADRLTRRTSLAAFAVAELAVGIFGLLSASLYYDGLYLRFGELAARPAVLPALLFVSLLWPTFFMGMSLPLLARALTRTIEGAAPTVGMLYGLNALGASGGALLTTWWLLPTLGLEGSLRVSALLNIGVALAAGVLTLRVSSADLPKAAGADQRIQTVGEMERLSFPSWLAIYALSGFLALSLEIAWFRVLGVTVKSSAFTFGTLLAVYLGGLGFGASLGSVVVHRVRRPAMGFLLVQTAIGIYVGLSVVLSLASLDAPALAWLKQHLGNYDPLDLGRAVLSGQTEFLKLYLGVPAVLIGPPTVLMGLSFPLLQRATQTDFDRLGTRVGTLMLANIAGSTLGAVLTGWWGLRYLGTAGTLKAAVAASGTFALIGLGMSLRGPARRWASALTCTTSVLLAGAVVTAMPETRTLWAALHGANPHFMFLGEDETGVSLVKLASGAFADRRAEVFVNGLGQSWLPYGDIHTALGVLPAFLHPDPRDVAVIGLGSGDTVFGLAGRREITRITCVEIVRPQLGTLVSLGRVYDYPGLQHALRDPRVEHVNGDGRIFAMRAGQQFDIIEADALRPGSAFAGNLYSDGYFRLLRDRLRPGGLAVTWAPTPRVRRTFLKVFPHVVMYGDILIGSGSPIYSNSDLIRSRLADPLVVEYYAAAGVDVRSLLRPYIGLPPQRFDESYDRSAIDDINTDLFPRDEFELPPLSAWRSQPVPTN